MTPWAANLIGLGLGFTIGGATLAIVFSAPNEVAKQPVVAAPSQSPPPPPPRLAANPPELPVLQPGELPRVLPPPLPQPQPDALPNIIRPTPQASPGRDAHKPGEGMTGTGFFVSSDGSLLTAAHVASDCAQIRIASRWVKPAAAQMVATDHGHDIALLRAASVKPPGVLPVGYPAAPTGRLFVLGYPASGGPLVPTETWAVLTNTQLQPAPAHLIDPRRVIWAEAPAIGHGFSGGPMVDPRNGEVVGIVRGMVDSTRLHAVRASIPASGMVTGPGSIPLNALLQQESADGDATGVSGDDALDAARRATVHVLCRY